MQLPRTIQLCFLLFLPLLQQAVNAEESAPFAPVTPNALPEVKAVLDLLYEISGDYTLTGQHNYPATKDTNTQFAADYIGKHPVVWSSDMGFAAEGDTDSYLARPDIVKEAIRQHQMGALVTLCWHAVPPTAEEPVTFRPLPDADPHQLASVQGDLTDEQFRDVLTPGTALYKQWCKQVDAVAVYLKQLEEARVPVLWRPYHEMNGGWFWWGGRKGESSTARLYRQVFDRLVGHHGLKNLIWVWSVDRVPADRPERAHADFYPGNDYLDVVALDVYGNDFAQAYYDSLEELARGKPMVLGEVGNPPALEVYEQQPKWAFYVTWAGMVRNTSLRQYHEIMASPRMLNLEDEAYAGVYNPYRAELDLPPVNLPGVREVDFTGQWLFNEYASELDNRGASRIPYAYELKQEGDVLDVTQCQLREFQEARKESEHYVLGGDPVLSEVRGAPREVSMSRSEDGESLIYREVIRFERNGSEMEAITEERWSLRAGGRELLIEHESTSPTGERSLKLVYTRLDTLDALLK